MLQLEEKELESVGALGNTREVAKDEWIESVCATHRNVLQDKENTARGFGRHSHSPMRDLHRVSINESPQIAVVEFEEARRGRPVYSVNASF